MKKSVFYFLCFSFPVILGLLTNCTQPSPVHFKTAITADAADVIRPIDGFGVNITPAQWHDGHLKPVLDTLVDDLGATLFRFDCTGLANWLDPARRNSDGSWPEVYLDSVYHSRVFTDAWATFRYLNSKGIEPFFNVSGRIPPGFGYRDDPKRLADFDGYAEMVVSMVKWAREKEDLRFSLLAPFNETDFGYPEGPSIDGDTIVTAIEAIVKKLEEKGLQDVKLIVPDDGNPRLYKLETILSDTSLVGHIFAFGTHTYGNGSIGENEDWYQNETNFARFAKIVKSSAFSSSSVWMTEYGDLDQTGLIPYEFSWRSTRRLMKALRDGFNAALVWDAFDNFHEHDSAWARYGLLATDTTNWSYTPKKRYFAAKQVYRFVRPGWNMVKVKFPEPEKNDVYKMWHDPFRNIRIQAFVSPDGRDFTVVFMNSAEQDVEMNIRFDGLTGPLKDKEVHFFVTTEKKNCEQESFPKQNGKSVTVVLPERSISTVSTLL